jgi:Mg-chelatase subunit ChlI
VAALEILTVDHPTVDLTLVAAHSQAELEQKSNIRVVLIVSAVAFRTWRGALAITGDDEIEAEARAMLRERLKRTSWFRTGLTPEQRQAAVEQEVEARWHLFVQDAIKRLQKERGSGRSDPGTVA